MDILICAPYGRTRVSGVSTFLRGFQAMLAERSHRVRFVTPDECGVLTAGPALRNLGLALCTLCAVLAARERYPIVHANQPHLQSAAAVLAAKVVGSRSVVTYHSALPPAHAWPAGAIQRIAHAVITASRATRVFVSDSLRQELGRPTDPVIHIGIEASLVASVPVSPGRPREEFVLVFVGRQTESKGFYDLIEAVKEVKRTSAVRLRLDLIGEAPVAEGARRAAALDEVSDFVVDHGVISDRRALLEAIAQADVLVLPSYHEGMPLALIEAMAVGCVPIASSVGGIPEIVKDRESGILIPPGDRRALKESIVWSLENRSALLEMGRRARDSVKGRFNLEGTVERYLRLYAGDDL